MQLASLVCVAVAAVVAATEFRVRSPAVNVTFPRGDRGVVVHDGLMLAATLTPRRLPDERLPTTSRAKVAEAGRTATTVNTKLHWFPMKSTPLAPPGRFNIMPPPHGKHQPPERHQRDKSLLFSILDFLSMLAVLAVGAIVIFFFRFRGKQQAVANAAWTEFPVVTVDYADAKVSASKGKPSSEKDESPQTDKDAGEALEHVDAKTGENVLLEAQVSLVGCDAIETTGITSSESQETCQHHRRRHHRRCHHHGRHHCHHCHRQPEHRHDASRLQRRGGRGAPESGSAPPYAPSQVDPPRYEPKAEPSQVDPPRYEPKAEPSQVDPPHREPKAETSQVDPPHREPKAEPSQVDPPHREPKKTGPEVESADQKN